MRIILPELRIQNEGGSSHVFPGECWVSIPPVGNFLFCSEVPGVTAIPSSSVSEGIVRQTYYREVLPLALHVRGFEVLHASAIETRHGVVAFSGPSGIGKSTLVARLQKEGYTAWADDAVVLIPEPSLKTLRIPFKICLKNNSPYSLDVEWQLEDAGIVHFIKAIVFLERKDDTCFEVVRPGASETYLLLLKNAISFLPMEPRRREKMVSHYLDIAAGVPIYRIRYPSGFQHFENVLQEMKEWLEKTV